MNKSGSLLYDKHQNWMQSQTFLNCEIIDEFLDGSSDDS